MTCVIDFFGTDDYHANESSPELALDEERDYFVNNIWDQINSSLNTYVWDSKIIPVSSTSSVKDRAFEAENWLQNSSNWASYGSSDCCVVLDNWGNGDYVGWATGGNAGGSYGKTGIIDFGEGDLLPADYNGIMYRRYVGHEVGHVFTAEHYHGDINLSNELSMMWEPGVNATCYNQTGDRDTTAPYYTSCSENMIEMQVNDSNCCDF